MAKQAPFRMTKLSSIKPYEHNPRIISQAAVDAVAKSIAAFGFRQPIVVDGHGVILAGHTRYKAAQQLGLTEVPVVWQSDITDIQARGYRIADNKTAELSAWDREALDAEVRELAGMDDSALASLGMSDWELKRILEDDSIDVETVEGAGGDSTRKDDPQRRPCVEARTDSVPTDRGELKYFSCTKGLDYLYDGPPPKLAECLDRGMYDEALHALEACGLPDEVRSFCELAATRLIMFNYTKIAQYYATASPDVRAAFERLTLVIPDLGKVISNGLTCMEHRLAELCQADVSFAEGYDNGTT